MTNQIIAQGYIGANRIITQGYNIGVATVSYSTSWLLQQQKSRLSPQRRNLLQEWLKVKTNG